MLLVTWHMLLHDGLILVYVTYRLFGGLYDLTLYLS